MQSLSSTRSHRRLVTQMALTPQLRTPEWNRILDLTETLTFALRRWYQRRTSMRALQVLSDWQLRDLGVPRGDIPAIVDRHLKVAPRPPARITRLVTAVAANAPDSGVSNDRPKKAA